MFSVEFYFHPIEMSRRREKLDCEKTKLILPSVCSKADLTFSHCFRFRLNLSLSIDLSQGAAFVLQKQLRTNLIQPY